MDTSLIGKAKEMRIASLLMEKGIYVYLPLVDKGFDLLASNKDGCHYIPIQIKYCKSRTGFKLKKQDAEKFLSANVVVVFVSKSKKEDSDDYWFVPSKEWNNAARDTGRQDDVKVVYLKDDPTWPDQFKGLAGIERAFSELLLDNEHFGLPSV